MYMVLTDASGRWRQGASKRGDVMKGESDRGAVTKSARSQKNSPTRPSLCLDKRLPLTPFSNLLLPPLFLFDAIFTHSVYAPPLTSRLHTCLQAPRHVKANEWLSRSPVANHEARKSTIIHPVGLVVQLFKRKVSPWYIQHRHYYCRQFRRICRIFLFVE